MLKYSTPVSEQFDVDGLSKSTQTTNANILWLTSLSLLSNFRSPKNLLVDPANFMARHSEPPIFFWSFNVLGIQVLDNRVTLIPK